MHYCGTFMSEYDMSEMTRITDVSHSEGTYGVSVEGFTIIIIVLSRRRRVVDVLSTCFIW